MATLKDISRRTGVSVTTISRVLNHDETMLVSRETSRAIFDTAFELGYIPLRRRRRQADQPLVIGIADWRVVVGGAPNITLSALRYSAEMEYPDRLLEFVQLGQGGELEVADGMIAVGDLSDEEIDMLRQISPYLVFVNASQRDYAYDRVVVDLNPVLAQTVSYLTEDKCYTHIGYISGRYEGDGYVVGDRRTQRITSLLLDHGLYDPELVAVGEFTQESGYAMAKRMFSRLQPPQALVVGSDMVAAGVFLALEEEGIVPGEDVELVVYRDIQTAQLPSSGYAVIQAYPDLLWQKAVQMIIEQMEGRAETVQTVISPRLLMEEEL